MKIFVTGFILLVLVAATLGYAVPKSLQENAHASPQQENTGNAFLQHRFNTCKSYNNNIIIDTHTTPESL